MSLYSDIINILIKHTAEPNKNGSAVFLLLKLLKLLQKKYKINYRNIVILSVKLCLIVWKTS